MNNRIESLNYLRGVLALSIMIYHYFLWMHLQPDLSNPLIRISLYGVAMCYVISGITNTISYQHYQYIVERPLLNFAYKRLVRILPLFALITMLTLFLNFKKQYETQTVLLNISGLFGFFDYTTYIATGAWSIGNLMVYYTLFPFLIYLYQRHLTIFLLLFLISILWTGYVSFFLLTNTETLAVQWPVYINPFNNIMFFIAGIYLSRYVTLHKIIKTWVKVVFVIVIVLFFLLPLNGDHINMITGSNRIIYVTLTIVIMTLMLFMEGKLPPLFHKPLSALGLHSYSIFLWHSVCFMLVSGANKVLHLHFPIHVVLAIAFLSMVPVCYFSRKYIEQIGPHREVK